MDDLNAASLETYGISSYSYAPNNDCVMGNFKTRSPGEDEEVLRTSSPAPPKPDISARTEGRAAEALEDPFAQLPRSAWPTAFRMAIRRTIALQVMGQILGGGHRRASIAPSEGQGVGDVGLALPSTAVGMSSSGDRASGRIWRSKKTVRKLRGSIAAGGRLGDGEGPDQRPPRADPERAEHAGPRGEPSGGAVNSAANRVSQPPEDRGDEGGCTRVTKNICRDNRTVMLRCRRKPLPLRD